MVTALLPPLTDESDAPYRQDSPSKPTHTSRDSVAALSPESQESQLTITPGRFAAQEEAEGDAAHLSAADRGEAAKPSVLAGFVGLFTGCGALVALVLFLPLPVRFGRAEGTTSAQAVEYSFYVVAAVACCVAVFVFYGLRGVKGEEGKGWRLLLGLAEEPRDDLGGLRRHNSTVPSVRDVRFELLPTVLDPQLCRPLTNQTAHYEQRYLPYGQLLRDSVRLGFTDPQIGLGYLGGFVARASTVAISLFIPLFVNTYFIRNGFCQGSPHDPSPELKQECRAAYVLASILTGVAQLFGLVCAPVFGYLASRTTRAVNVPVIAATSFGIVGYLAFPSLRSPELKDVDGRGGGPAVILAVVLVGISQIGSIVCSLGSLGRGVLTVDVPESATRASGGRDGAEPQPHLQQPAGDETSPLLPADATPAAAAAPLTMSRVRLKGSIAGVYSWYGGAAILLLTKLGGYLFDEWSTGAPFYMMAAFNAVLLVAALAVDVGRFYNRCGSAQRA